MYITTNTVNMFHQVSWPTYFLAFATVAGIYYTIITPLFFRQQVRRIFTRRKASGSRERTTEDNIPDAANDYFTYESLRDDITAYLEGEEEDALKSDILSSLLSIIKKHPVLQDERFQGAMGKEIRRLYNGKYNDSLTEGELASLWTA